MEKRFWSVPIRLSEGEGALKEIQIFREGVFQHEYYGQVIFNRSMFEQIIENFEKKVLGVDIALDYAHNVYGKAAAWFQSLFIKEENGKASLWAGIKWTASGEDCAKNGEYRYISGDVNKIWRDPESGVEYMNVLNGAALTNRPFVKGMGPVQLSELNEERNMIFNEQEQKAIKEAMDKNGVKTPVELAVKLSTDTTAEAATLKAKVVELEGTIKLQEKQGQFNTMLATGAVVEAQRAAFIGNDMIKFAELAGKVNLNGAGHSENGADEIEGGDVEAKVMKLAEEAMKADKTLRLDHAISKVLRSDAALAKQYNDSQA